MIFDKLHQQLKNGVAIEFETEQRRIAEAVAKAEGKQISPAEESDKTEETDS